MTARRLLAAILLLIALVPSLGAVEQKRLRFILPAVGGGSSPLESGAHPRIFFTSSDVTTLRTKLAGDYFTEYQAYVTELATHLSTSLPGDWLSLGDDAVSMCFVYAVGTVSGIDYGMGNTSATYGTRAVAIIESWRTRASGDFRGTSPIAAITFDWCYPLLNSTQKSALVNDATGGMKNLPYQTDGAAWNYYSVGLLNISILGGLACANEGIDDSACATMYGRYSTMGRDALDAYSSFASTSGGFKNLNTYSTVEMTGIIPLVMMVDAWRTANGLTKSATWGASYANVIHYYAQWHAYRIRPWAKSNGSRPGGRDYFMYSDSVNQDNPAFEYYAFGGDTGLVQVLKALTGYGGVDNNMAGLAMWLLENRIGGDYAAAVYATSHSAQVFSDFLWGTKATELSPTDLSLPLSKYFDGMGQIVMRTGWTSANDTTVTYTGLKWHTGASGTTETATGFFTIDRNGPLIINSGSGGHHYYAGESFSRNIPVFVDPSDPQVGSGANGTDTGKRSAIQWDMGGQRRTSGIDASGATLASLTNGSKYDFGGISRYRLYDGANADVDYAFSDMTNAYNGSSFSDSVNTLKVSNVTRHFVYFRKQSSSASDTVVIYDRQTTLDSKYLKRNFFHLAAQPTITYTGSHSAVRTGLDTYGDATLATITNTTDGSDGKCYISPLLPTSVTIRVVGGPNGSGTWSVTAGTTTDAHEFEDPFGLQWYDEFGSNTAEQAGYSLANLRQYYGPYRIEVQPTTNATSDILLTTFECGDSTLAQSTTATWSGTNFKAARVGNRVAAFADTETTRTSGTLVFATAGTYKVLWADLSGSARTFTGGANITSITNAVDGTGSSGSSFTVDSDSKTVYLTIVVSTNGTGAANTVTIS